MTEPYYRPDLDKVESFLTSLTQEVEAMREGEWVPRADLEAANRSIANLQSTLDRLLTELAKAKSHAAPVPLIFRDKADIEWVLSSICPDLAEEIRSLFPKEENRIEVKL